jgi:hypothetical protein
VAGADVRDPQFGGVVQGGVDGRQQAENCPCEHRGRRGAGAERMPVATHKETALPIERPA